MASSTVGSAVEEYLDSPEFAKKGSRGPTLVELRKFSGWYGASRDTSNLRGHDVATYAESMGPANPDNTRRAEHIRKFLIWLKGKGYAEQSLAPHLRLKKMPRSGGARVESASQTTVELTADGIAALETELASLMEDRISIRQDIGTAMQDKDFRENSPLDAAKEKQGHIEARIREIEAMLKRAVIVDGALQTGRVRVGSKVRVKNLGSEKITEYSIVGPTEANAAEGKISSVSPVGKALINATAGDEVNVDVPAGTMTLVVEAVHG
ncbi:MAG: transcription elongation factor GreA [Dehalococcoidia bacterium]